MSQLSEDECSEIVKKYLHNSEFELLEWNIKNIHGTKPGFLGVPTNLTINVLHNGMTNSKTLQFFVKHVPNGNSKLEDLVRTLRVFYKESEIYVNILTTLKPYIIGNIFPEFFYTRTEDILVLEDLCLLGLKTKPIHEICDVAHCEITIRALAKLHAASIVYEEKNCVKLNELYPNLFFETLFIDDPSNPNCMHINVSIKALNHIMSVHFKTISLEIRKKTSALLKNTFTTVHPPKNHRAVFTHGDLWTNNIMFHYDLNGNVDDVRLVDFQLARYHLPAFDVLLFLYLSTSYSFRKENLERFLANYYKYLGDELANAEININQIITWDEFKASIKEALPTVLCITPIYLHYILLPQNVIEQMMNDAEEYEKIVKINRNDLIDNVMRTYRSYNDCISICMSELFDYVQKH